ncbi:MAG: plasmid pRiA4b ORF-3 family protein [Planctomycetota bacterium]
MIDRFLAGIWHKAEHRSDCSTTQSHGSQNNPGVYDFGDDWRHEIEVEKVLEPEAGAGYPICLAGELACPVEDCGGPWGYQEMLEILKDPVHEEYEHYFEWLGGEFDPEEFDLEKVNGRFERT